VCQAIVEEYKDMQVVTMIVTSSFNTKVLKTIHTYDSNNLQQYN